MSENPQPYDDGKTKLEHLTTAQFSLLKAQQLLSHAVQLAIIEQEYPQLEHKPIKHEAILKALRQTIAEVEKAAQGQTP